jgi:integrase
VVLSLITAARYSELAGLQWVDVHFEKKRIVFRETKNGEGRKFPLTEEAKAIFQQLYKS